MCLASPFYGEEPKILGYVAGRFKINAEERAAFQYAATYRDKNNIIFVRPADITMETPDPAPPPPPPKKVSVWDLIRRRDLFDDV